MLIVNPTGLAFKHFCFYIYVPIQYSNLKIKTLTAMKVLKIIGFSILVLTIALYLLARLNHITPIELVDKSSFNSYSGVAIKGYDPVAYFKSNSAVEGSSKFSTNWSGIDWYFSSAENKAAFEADPKHYAPLFGGYCAFAITTGYTATIDPRAFTIYEERLLLFNGPDVKVSFMVDAENSYITAVEKWK